MSPATATPYSNPLINRPERPLPKKVAIVGAGTIGPDIGYYLKSAISDLTLVLVDLVQEPIDKALARIESYVQKGLAKRKLSEAQAEAVRKNLIGTVDYADMADCDWVIESATENLDLKKKIFAQIEAVVRPDTIITSNTSSLPASRMFSELAHKERATVTHFFAPAFRNPAVEVIRWDECDRSVVEYLRWLFCTTGKVPLVTEDVLCFMLDRIFDNWCNEAAYLLDRATAAEVDTVSREFVHAGPFFVLNLAHGNPIIVETNTLQMEEGEHYRPADIFRSVETWKTVSPRQRVDVSPETKQAVRDRLLGILLSQSVDIVDRGIGTASDLDLGCCLALGFKKGPFELVRDLGEADAKGAFRRFLEDRPGMPEPQRDLATYPAFRRHVLVDEVGAARVITIRRPQAMNALDDEVTAEILSVIEELEDDPNVAGFVITGYGNRAFCAGADIGRFPEVLGKADEAAQYARDCSPLLLHLDKMSKPVVAALNGMTLGGGLELALRCHALVAVTSAWLQFPEINLGIAPGLGGMVVPYRRWPEAAPLFHDMLRLGSKLKAPEAAEVGVITALATSPEELIQVAVAKVEELAGAVAAIPDGAVDIAPLPEVDAAAAKPPLSREVVAIIGKAITAAAAAETLEEALEIGYAAFGRSACTAAADDGVNAFLLRRRPDYTKTG